jgi:hypothetical protein
MIYISGALSPLRLCLLATRGPPPLICDARHNSTTTTCAATATTSWMGSETPKSMVSS